MPSGLTLTRQPHRIPTLSPQPYTPNQAKGLLAQLQSNVNTKAMGRRSIVAAAETASKLSELAEKGAALARAIGRKVQGPRLARITLYH